jgi:hypothetical protein
LLKENQRILNFLELQRKLLPIFFLSLTILLLIVLNRYYEERNTERKSYVNIPIDGKYLGIFRGGRFGSFCQIELENHQTILVRCNNSSIYHIGQDIKFYKVIENQADYHYEMPLLP